MAEPAPGDNLKRAELFFELWNSGVREIREDLTDPEIEMHTPLSSTRGGPYRGYEGVRHWLSDIDEQFDSWSSTVDEMSELEDGRVMVLGTLHLRGRGSGAELDQPMGWLFSFREGRILRYEVFGSHAETVEAAGSQA